LSKEKRQELKREKAEERDKWERCHMGSFMLSYPPEEDDPEKAKYEKYLKVAKCIFEEFSSTTSVPSLGALVNAVESRCGKNFLPKRDDIPNVRG
jgi:hypothetical protein